MKVFFLNATSGGLEVARIFAAGQRLTGYIGLAAERSNQSAAGYLEGRDFCRAAGIPYYEARSYSLNDPDDRALIEELGIDVLIVSGWQRLVPEPVIAACGAVLGVHGSPLGITQGRGRSPQNWALIRGWPDFELSIFRITPGIDSGEVLASGSFRYNLRDDIHSSYLKTAYLTGQLLLSLAAEGRLMAAGRAQDESVARYLPQRTPEDGQIDWRRPAAEVVDLIRALTRPYPGAFTTHARQRISIWDALAFEGADAPRGAAPGTLIHRYGSGELLIGCGSGAVIIRDHDLDAAIEAGTRFASADHEAQLATILGRHRRKYPGLPLADQLVGSSAEPIGAEGA